jgi:hypothetical protein
MRTMMILLAIGFCVMASVITYGFVAGDLVGEAKLMLAYPWFQISMVDLYTGFLLFGGWIIFRERSRTTAILWIILLLTLGNLASCAYAFLAAVQSRGNWHIFWLGCHAPTSTESVTINSREN